MPGDVVRGTTNLIVDKTGQPEPAATNIKEVTSTYSPFPHVAFDFNGQHFVVPKKRVEATTITDVGQTPYESNEVAIQRRIAMYLNTSVGLSIKLPDIQLQRSGAASTTGTRDVANEWGGVGNLPPDPIRVVLRIETPPTSVLSLPIYGANNTSEHEVVIVGTKDKWLWDAWRNRAPSFDEVPIVQPVKKAESQTLVIDLQAEDRGKPHWMSTVDWSKVS
jgi:hypothetical protein